MVKCVCDICNEREASRKFKVKVSRKGMYLHAGSGIRWDSSVWQPWQKIHICGECGEKLLGLTYRDSNGFGRPPVRK